MKPLLSLTLFIFVSCSILIGQARPVKPPILKISPVLLSQTISVGKATVDMRRDRSSHPPSSSDPSCAWLNLKQISDLAGKFDLDTSRRGHLGLTVADLSYYREQMIPEDLLLMYFSTMKILLDSMPQSFRDKGELAINLQRTIFDLDSRGQLTEYSATFAGCKCPPGPPPGTKVLDILTDKRFLELPIYKQDLDYVKALIKDQNLAQSFLSLNTSDSTAYEYGLFEIAQQLELRCVSPSNLNMYFFRGDARAIMDDETIQQKNHLVLLAAEKVILLAAQRENFKIRDKGDLTHFSEQFIQDHKIY